MSGFTVNIAVRRPTASGAPFLLEAAFETEGGLTVVFGPSGAGKSTLLLAILGALRPSRGRIVAAGRVLFDAARPVILNGIEDIVTRPDLADRAVFLTLEPIPEERRRSLTTNRSCEKQWIGENSCRQPDGAKDEGFGSRTVHRECFEKGGKPHPCINSLRCAERQQRVSSLGGVGLELDKLFIR